MAINFNLTVNLVQICIKKKVNKFIYISSTDAINIKEGKIVEPKTFELEGLDNYYAITKAMASDYVLKTINDSCGTNTFVNVSSDLFELLEKSIDISIIPYKKGFFNYFNALFTKFFLKIWYI